MGGIAPNCSISGNTCTCTLLSPQFSPERKKLLLNSKRKLLLSGVMSLVTGLPLCYRLLVEYQELDKVADWNRYRRGDMGRGEIGL